jgi:putative transposase
MFRAGELLKLPKIGALKVRWSRIPVGIPKMVTVIKDSNDRYFVSFSCEEEIKELPTSTKAVGVDLGIKDVFVLSDGYKSGNPRHLAGLLRKKRIFGRRLSRKTKGSNRWHEMRKKLAKLDSHIAACRADWLHKATTGIIRSNQVIAIEDLNVRGMMRNGRLARHIGDVGMGEFRRQLTYKADWYGRDLLVIDRWAPSSKTCSDCGQINQVLTLKDREWTCECGATHDRDINAAANLKLFAVSSTVTACGGEGSGFTARKSDKTKPASVKQEINTKFNYE